IVNVPMFVSAIVWGTALAVLTRREVGVRPVATAAVVTFAVFGTWAVPVIYDFVRFDGFTDVATLGVEWELLDGVAAWGLLVPLALAGIGITVTQPAILRRALLAFAASALALLVITWVRAFLGWDVFANETLLHQGRYWPPLHLIAAAFAGIAITVGYGWLRTRSKLLALSAAVVVLGIGAISPVYASIGLTRTIDERKDGFLYATPELVDGSPVRAAADEMDPDEIMVVEDGDVLAFYLWQFSGTRIADSDDSFVDTNPWRIRYRELARRWYVAERAGDFEPDWAFSKSLTRASDDERRVVTFRGETWQYGRIRD
ncbi:MAG: hypothetical protein M3161_06880, partial [Actinomycetota bacterium]|nr:hypothetical protein [Actinomycetota bacterium]